ncbi:MAG: hypothetical protein U0U67_00605 [Chitinophagales bacterium]
MEYLDTHKNKIVCPQCGANDFVETDASHIECTHCQTQIDTTIVLTDNTNKNMKINDGANVEIKDNSHVKIKGGLVIEGGKLTITNGGSLEIG